MKREWDPVTLRVAFWNASEQPVEGDELRTLRGRRYQILAIKHTGDRITSLDCLVLPSDAAEQGRVFLWTWSPRR